MEGAEESENMVLSLLASYDSNADQFRSTTKVGTGFTDESLAQFFKDLEKYFLHINIHV